MDTRQKIVSLDEAVRQMRTDGPWQVVAGTFDPLLAEHAEQLAQASTDRLLLVLVGNPAKPLLPLRARAELVAGLACTRLVLMHEGDPHDALPGVDVLNERNADESRTAALLAHIRARHGG